MSDDRILCDRCGLQQVGAEDELDQLRTDLAAERARADALQAFKDYVHRRLDDAGVPVDPESPHKAAGCRIGGRLDAVFADRDRLRAAIEQAPHGRYCLGDDFLMADGKRHDACNCWKSRALAEGEAK
jgi:hypothetical protein